MAMSTLAKQTSRCAAVARPVAISRVRSVVVRAQKQEKPLSHLVTPALTAVVANALMALPAMADAGKIFDFNLTLPVMAGEFLLLMVFLEKTWFTPVGKVLDERDALIREKLGSVKDNTGDVDKLIMEAEGMLKEARSAVSNEVTGKKNAKQAELDSIYNSAKSKIQSETETAIAVLEKESGAMLATLDAQVDKISGEVLKRVLPEGVKI